eukprot:3954476-Alexandrium_andersonii.AAC.1
MPTSVPAACIVGAVFVGASRRGCACQACLSPWRARDGSSWQMHLEGAVPVSYTHLTLPTICSV